MAEESKFITRKEKKEKTGPYITKKKKKIDLGEIMSKALSEDERNFLSQNAEEKRKYEMQLQKAEEGFKKKLKQGPFITRKNTTDKETVGDAQKRGKIDLGKVINFKKGGRVKKRKNTRRMNRLEELGRVDAEKAFTKRGKKNLKAEKKRIVRELKSSGGSAGVALRGKGCEIR
jgi:hypothetical protein|tara:strand:- start:172 stop:693 length:522 start_codon:yes stop_codon:yes gene_type:complete